LSAIEFVLYCLSAAAAAAASAAAGPGKLIVELFTKGLGETGCRRENEPNYA